MKTIRTLTLMAAAVCAIACNRQPAPELETLETDTLLAAEGGSCQVDYRFVTIRNAARSKALQAIEQDNIGYFFQLEEFAGSAEEAAAASLDEIREELLAPLAAFAATMERPHEYQIAIAAEAAVVDTLLNYTIRREGYTGGAHGYSTVEHHTYSLASGDELTLRDVLTEAQHAALEARIREKLYAQYGAADDAELAALGMFPQDIAPTDNFLLGADGSLTLHYNPYEIACYAFGPVVLRFDAAELAAMK